MRKVLFAFVITSLALGKPFSPIPSVFFQLLGKVRAHTLDIHHALVLPMPFGRQMLSPRDVLVACRDCKNIAHDRANLDTLLRGSAGESSEIRIDVGRFSRLVELKDERHFAEITMRVAVATSCVE